MWVYVCVCHTRSKTVHSSSPNTTALSVMLHDFVSSWDLEDVSTVCSSPEKAWGKPFSYITPDRNRNIYPNLNHREVMGSGWPSWASAGVWLHVQLFQYWCWESRPTWSLTSQKPQHTQPHVSCPLMEVSAVRGSLVIFDWLPRATVYIINWCTWWMSTVTYLLQY